MASEPAHVEAAIETSLARVRTFFDADRCGLLSVRPDQRWARVQFASYGDGIAPVSGDINLAEAFPWARGMLLEERAPVVVYRLTDLPPEAAADRFVWEHMGVRSNLAVPVFVGTEVPYVIVIHWVHQEWHIPDLYIPRLRVLGDVAVSALQRKEAADRAARQSARVAAAVDLAGIGFSEWTVGSGPPYVDARMRDLLGLPADDADAADEYWLSRVHPDDRRALEEQRGRLLAGELDRLAFEYRYEHPVRGRIWLRHTSRRDDDSDGPGAVRVVEAVQDITERRSREEELRQLRDRLQTENLYLRQESARHFGDSQVGGRGPAIRQALALAEQVAPTNATVLLTGETGTGKERFATLLHEASPRRARPMVRVNCSAIPTALIESELFGRERGAFTGAVARQIGRFEIANGSTLFLDEVSDLPADVQVKLLRVLQERTLERLGSSRPVEVDVRIIAATNRKLEDAVREGTFRSDLFYRLNVFPIVVPPLRQRREDIPALVADLIEDIGAAMGKRFDAVGRASMEALQRYDWPGNVRELRNVLERAMILSPGPTLQIDPAMVPMASPARDAAATPVPTLHLDEVERAHILRVLREVGWRIKGPDSASVRLGMKPGTLYGRIKKLGIVREQ